MATIRPFRALRPVPGKVKDVACVPYDVVSVDEARALAAGNPDSFLHVVRPEIDLPEGTDEHAPEVYETGAANLRRYAESPISLLENAPALYVYRLVMQGRSQTGLFACVAVDEYDDDTILKHEKTRPAKEDDRTRHILTQRAHAEPVMLTYRDDPDVLRLTKEITQTEALYDFTAADGVQHTIWKAAEARPLVETFALIENLYVADGHHRCKAASRAWHYVEKEGRANEMPEAAFFPAVLFPMRQMHILPYNRIVYNLPLSKTTFLEKMEAFGVQPHVADPTPNMPGEVCIYLDGHWHRIELPGTERDTVADALDVARLNEYVLGPILGITDPRTDENIDFVGGIRGTEELERRVDSGEAALAFSMYPTSIEELVAVSDAALLMPPKSTWFEPKLRSGLLVHVFG